MGGGETFAKLIPLSNVKVPPIGCEGALPISSTALGGRPFPFRKERPSVKISACLLQFPFIFFLLAYQSFILSFIVLIPQLTVTYSLHYLCFGA
jgi:hypothetical protein